MVNIKIFINILRILSRLNPQIVTNSDQKKTDERKREETKLLFETTIKLFSKIFCSITKKVMNNTKKV